MKITVKTKKKTKVVSLSEQQVFEIKASEFYEKIHNTLISKAQISLMRTTYFKRAFWYEFLLLCLAAFATTIAIDYFISSTGKTGLFPGGLGSFARFLSVVTYPDNASQQGSFYFVYYFLLNIPLIIFGYLKLGVKFTLTTLLYMVLSIGFDQIITRLPVINPTEWHFVLDYQLISSLQDSWNTTIWLFVFAFFGGALLGWSLATTYKVGASSGGTDFLTLWFAKKKNKDIGTINRNMNFVILFIVIISNTMLLVPEDFHKSFKYSVLNSSTNAEILNLNGIDEWFKSSPLWNESQPTTLADALKNSRQEVLRLLSTDPNFSGYSSSMLAILRVKFIFGPTLFASVILVIVQGVAINVSYPKNVKRTILLTTTKPDEVKKFLFDSGYRNDVLIHETEIHHSGREMTKKKVLTITTTLMNWKSIEKGVMNVDLDMNANVIQTRAVKGPFISELKDERRMESIKLKLSADKKMMNKIDKEAIYKTWKRMQSKIKK